MPKIKQPKAHRNKPVTNVHELEQRISSFAEGADKTELEVVYDLLNKQKESVPTPTATQSAPESQDTLPPPVKYAPTPAPENKEVAEPRRQTYKNVLIPMNKYIYDLLEQCSKETHRSKSAFVRYAIEQAALQLNKKDKQ